MTATETPPLLGRAFRRVKKIVADPSAKLADALAPVRTMLDKWKQIQEEHRVACSVPAAYKERLDTAIKDFEASKSPESHERLFLARTVMKEMQEQASGAQRSAYSGSLETKWRSEFPTARQT
jgi:hypothetical protein